MANQLTQREQLAEAKAAAVRAITLIEAAEAAEDEGVIRSRALEAGTLLSDAGRRVTGAAGPEQRPWGTGLSLPGPAHRGGVPA